MKKSVVRSIENEEGVSWSPSLMLLDERIVQWKKSPLSVTPPSPEISLVHRDHMEQSLRTPSEHFPKVPRIMPSFTGTGQSDKLNESRCAIVPKDGSRSNRFSGIVYTAVPNEKEKTAHIRHEQIRKAVFKQHVCRSPTILPVPLSILPI